MCAETCQTTVTERKQDSFTLTVAKSTEEVGSLRRVWAELQGREHATGPNADIDHFLTVIRHKKNVVRPHVVLLSRGEEPRAMLVARIDEDPVAFTIGYKTVAQPTARCLTVVHQGAFLGDDPEASAALFAELQRSLLRGEADMASLHMIPVDTELYRLFRTVPRAVSRDYYPFVTLHWRRGLPARFEELRQAWSKNHRKSIRKSAKKLRRDHNGDVEVRLYEKPEDVGFLIEHVESIARTTYQRGLGVAFNNDTLTRERMALAAQQGWLRSYLLHVNGTPCSYQLGFRYGAGYFAMGRGYDPAFKHYSAGTHVFLTALERACEDTMIDFWDFGIGDAEHKHVYGTEQWQEAKVYIFSRSLKGLKLSALWTVTNLLSDMGRRVLGKTGLLKKIKRFWRYRLQASQRD